MCQLDDLSIIDTIADLQRRGFYYDLCFLNDRLFCAQLKRFLKEDEFNITEMYRFPAYDKTLQETVIYGIESSNQLMRGILLNSFTATKASIPPVILKKVCRFRAEQ